MILFATFNHKNPYLPINVKSFVAVRQKDACPGPTQR